MRNREKLLNAIEAKLKDIVEFGCECKRDVASDLLTEFFPTKDQLNSELYKKFYGEHNAIET